MADNLPVSEINMSVEFQKTESKATFESSFFGNVMERSLNEEYMFDKSLTSSQIETLCIQNGTSDHHAGADSESAAQGSFVNYVIILKHHLSKFSSKKEQDLGAAENPTTQEGPPVNGVPDGYNEALQREEFAQEQMVKQKEALLSHGDDEETFPPVEIPIIFEKKPGEEEQNGITPSEGQGTNGQIPTIIETQPSLGIIHHDSLSDKPPGEEERATEEKPIEAVVNPSNAPSGPKESPEDIEKALQEAEALHKEISANQEEKQETVVESMEPKTPDAPEVVLERAESPQGQRNGPTTVTEISHAHQQNGLPLIELSDNAVSDGPKPVLEPSNDHVVGESAPPAEQNGPVSADQTQPSPSTEQTAPVPVEQPQPSVDQAGPQPEKQVIPSEEAPPQPTEPAAIPNDTAQPAETQSPQEQQPSLPIASDAKPQPAAQVKKPPPTDSEEEEEDEEGEDFVPVKSTGGFKLISGGAQPQQPAQEKPAEAPSAEQPQPGAAVKPEAPKPSEPVPETQVGQALQPHDVVTEALKTAGEAALGSVVSHGKQTQPLEPSKPQQEPRPEPAQQAVPASQPEATPVEPSPKKEEQQPQQKPAQSTNLPAAGATTMQQTQQTQKVSTFSSTKGFSINYVTFAKKLASLTTKKTWKSETTTSSQAQQQSERSKEPPPTFQPAEWIPEKESVTSPPPSKLQFQPAKVGQVWPPPQSEEDRQASPVLTGKRQITSTQWIQHDSVSSTNVKSGAPWAKSVAPQGVNSQRRSESSERPPPLKIAQAQATAVKKQWPPKPENDQPQFAYTHTEGPQPMPTQKKQWPPPPEPEPVPAQAVIHEPQVPKSSMQPQQPRPTAIGTGFRPIEPADFYRPMSPTPLSPGQTRFTEQGANKWPVHQNAASESSQTQRYHQQQQQQSMTSHTSRTTKKTKVTRQWPPAQDQEIEPEGTRAQVVHTPASQEHRPIYAQSRPAPGNHFQATTAPPTRFSHPGPQAPPKPLAQVLQESQFRPGIPQQMSNQQMAYQAQQQHNAPTAGQIPIYQSAPPRGWAPVGGQPMQAMQQNPAKGWSPGGQGLQHRQEVHNFQQGNMQGQTVYNQSSQQRQYTDPSTGGKYVQRFSSQQQSTVMRSVAPGGGQRWPPPSQP